jgi:hypothetical protein
MFPIPSSICFHYSVLTTVTTPHGRLLPPCVMMVVALFLPTRIPQELYVYGLYREGIEASRLWSSSTYLGRALPLHGYLNMWVERRLVLSVRAWRRRISRLALLPLLGRVIERSRRVHLLLCALFIIDAHAFAAVLASAPCLVYSLNGTGITFYPIVFPRRRLTRRPPFTSCCCLTHEARHRPLCFLSLSVSPHRRPTPLHSLAFGG